MQKIFIISATMLLSACSCFESNDEEYQDYRDSEEVYESFESRQAPKHPSDSYMYYSEQGMRQQRRPNYRYVMPTPQMVQAPQPAPQPMMVPAPQPVNVQCNVSPTMAPAPGCAPTVRETKEPVEIVYKKTTYTTVYEPKTTSAISYEKEAYNPNVALPAPTTVAAPVPVPAPMPTEVISENVRVEVRQ